MNDFQMIKRILKIKFFKATMNESQRDAYKNLVGQVDRDVEARDCSKQKITVSADISQRDAMKALRLIKLQYDPSWDFQITWEGLSGKKTKMSEKPPTP